MAADTPTAIAPATSLVPALLTKSLIRKHYVPVSERTLDRWISSGTFPPPDISIGGKVRYWKRETVEAWIEQSSRDQSTTTWRRGPLT